MEQLFKTACGELSVKCIEKLSRMVETSDDPFAVGLIFKLSAAYFAGKPKEHVTIQDDRSDDPDARLTFDEMRADLISRGLPVSHMQPPLVLIEHDAINNDNDAQVSDA